MQGIMQKGAQPEMDVRNEAPAGDDESSGNEAYDAGMQLVRQALYVQEGAKDIAKTMTSDNPAQALADHAYKMIEIADERTMGEIPDELLVQFAMEVLGEVAEIAEAAGVNVDGQVIADAFSSMLKQFLQSQGMDTTEIEAAMAQMNQSGIGGVLDEAAGQEM